MKNPTSKERALEEKKQDEISSRKENQEKKAIISIEDVSEKHHPSKNTHDLPQDEQQYDNFPKSKEE